MRRLIGATLGLMGAVLAGMLAAAAPPPAPPSDWGPIVTGQLPNGLRYAVLPRRGHEAGVGVLMRIEGGFFAEHRPGERGLVHLVEHAALLSPTTGSPDDLRHFLHTAGPVTLAAPSAGTTSWRETNYFLSSRRADLTDLDRVLGVYREVASDLTLRADAVDEARGQVVAEMAWRKPGNVTYARYIAAVAPGSPTDVIDAQNSDDVPTAGVETIRALYHRLYQPRRAMIVVVGPVDSSRAASLIENRFGGWRRDGTAPLPSPSRFRADRIAPISADTGPGARRVAMITVVMPNPPIPASRRRQADAALIDMLMTRVATSRLAAAQPGAAPGKVGMHIEHGEQGHRLIMLWDGFAEGGWEPAVAGLARAACEVRTAGFSDAAWATAEVDFMRDLEHQADAMAATANVELAKDLSHALADGQDLIPPDELLRDARALFPMLPARAGRAWWRAQWQRGTAQLRVEAPELTPADPIPAIRSVANDAVGPAACKVRS